MTLYCCTFLTMDDLVLLFTSLHGWCYIIAHLFKATPDKQSLMQEMRDFCLKRQKSPVCGRQRREIFVARDENEKSNMFDIYNNGQEIFISCDKNRSYAVFWRSFSQAGHKLPINLLRQKLLVCACIQFLARDKNLSSLAIKIARLQWPLHAWCYIVTNLFTWMMLHCCSPL